MDIVKLDTYKYGIGELVFCKFRGKWDIGRIETCGRKGLDRFYDISIRGAKRFQRKLEDEIKPTVKI